MSMKCVFVKSVVGSSKCTSLCAGYCMCVCVCYFAFTKTHLQEKIFSNATLHEALLLLRKYTNA